MFRYIIFIFLLILNFNSIQSKSLRRLINKNEHPCVIDKVLDLSNLKLSSIEGIQNYPEIDEVETLILNDNKLKSIEPLSLLSKNKIQKIDLSSNKISNLQPLTKLHKLREIYIESNLIDVPQIKEVVFNLKHLEILMVDENPIENNAYRLCAKKYKKINFLEILPYIICKDIDDVEMVKAKNTDIDDRCTICLDEDNLYQTICEHRFHLSCLDQWIKECNKNSLLPVCPLCKSILKS